MGRSLWLSHRFLFSLRGQITVDHHGFSLHHFLFAFGLVAATLPPTNFEWGFTVASHLLCDGTSQWVVPCGAGDRQMAFLVPRFETRESQHRLQNQTAVFHHGWATLLRRSAL